MAPVCAELLVPSHNHWASLPLPQGPGLEPLLFPMLIFPPPHWLRHCDLRQKIGGTRTLEGDLPPKANQPGTPRELMDSRGPRSLLKWSPK